MTTEETKYPYEGLHPDPKETVPMSQHLEALEVTQEANTIALLNELIEEVEKIRRKVAERQGTSKYDSCYYDCITLLKSKLNK